MTFKPQHSIWSENDFNQTGNFTYDNPTEYVVTGGKTQLLKTSFSTGTFTYTTNQIPVSNWDIQNPIDTDTQVLTNFNIFKQSGGVAQNVSDYMSMGFATAVTFIETGALGILYPPYYAGAFVYNLSGAGMPTPYTNKFTIDVGVRSVDDFNKDNVNINSGFTGLIYPGIYIAEQSKYAFLEMHPDGIKLQGKSGHFLPLDLQQFKQNIRIVKLGDSLAIQAENGSTLYINSGFTSTFASNTGTYVAFGAPSITGAPFNGIYKFHNLSGFLWDQSGKSGAYGFKGFTIWDDIKISLTDAAIEGPQYIVSQYPLTTKTLYTDEWYPPNNTSQYLEAKVDFIPNTGGSTTVTVQQFQYNTTFETGAWNNVKSIVINDKIQQINSKVIDLKDISVYQYPLVNKLKFKISTLSTGGNTPEIDNIFVLSKTKDNDVKFIPNWKLSSIPQDIYIKVNQDSYQENFPPPNTQDEVFFHNEDNLSTVPVNTYISGFSPGKTGGLVKFTSMFQTGKGLIRITDGYYNNAWRNFNKVDSYSGSWYEAGYKYIDKFGLFKGKLLSNISEYPHKSTDIVNTALGALSGLANIEYFTEEIIDQYGYTKLAQGCTVSNFTGVSQRVGIALTGINVPGTVQHKIGIVQGIISIPKGPGVYANLHQNQNTYSYFLDGHLYRDPTPFGIAALYTGNQTVTGTFVSFTVPSRSQTPPSLDPVQWLSYKNEIEKHTNDEFILYNITGYIADHCYVQYTGMQNTYSRTPIKLDSDLTISNSGTFQSLSNDLLYYPIQRDSVLFEGWVRPFGIVSGFDYGINSDAALIFSSVHTDANQQGFRIYLNKNGEINATISLAKHSAVTGMTGTGIAAIGLDSMSQISDGTSTILNLSSDGEKIYWGQWNHIGFAMDQRAIGDSYDAANQPLAPGYSGTGIIQGARTSKAYLFLNEKIVNSYDLSPDEYPNYISYLNQIAPTYPSGQVYNNVWPQFVRNMWTAAPRVNELGKEIVADFDHIRYGIRDKIDSFTTLNTYGSKAMPPAFTPYDAVKIPVLVSGSNTQYEFAHIYRFDRPLNYNGWDDGFSTNHLLYKNYSGHAIYTSYGLKASDLIKTIEDGPKGRPAIRIGPGANLLVPYSSFDERIYNGSGTFAGSLNIGGGLTGALYHEINQYNGTNLLDWSRQLGYKFQRTNANTFVRLGGWWRIPAYPASGIGDFITFEERGPLEGVYGRGQIYLGVSAAGNPVYGTRTNFQDNGFLSESSIGPFTGSGVLPINQWFHLGLDSNLPISVASTISPYMKLYFSGDIIHNSGSLSSHSLILTPSGNFQNTRGRGIANLGRLAFTGASNYITRSCFKIGGDVLRNQGYSGWTYRHFITDASEVVVGYGLQFNSGINPLDTSQWNWKLLATTGTKFTGNTDKAFINTSQYISDVQGTGVGTTMYYTGIMTYPATTYNDAGQYLLWTTINNGNDPEGLLMAGLPMFGNGSFENANSYYATYQNDNTSQVLGTTDSPIQIASTVPDDAINLALLSNKEWSSNNATITFNIVDKNEANISSKALADILVTGFYDLEQINGLDAIVTWLNDYSSDNDILSSFKIGSYPLWNIDQDTSNIGYYTHLIGKGQKTVYVLDTLPHESVTGNLTGYYSNFNKISQLISIRDSNGNIIDYNRFPYSIVLTPYDLNKFNPSIVTGTYGYGNLLNKSMVLPNNEFNIILLSSKQTIDETVWIHYPSKDTVSEIVNLQDSEIYNPIPTMKRQIDVYNESGVIKYQSGYYSIFDNSLYIWGADLNGFADNA